LTEALVDELAHSNEESFIERVSQIVKIFIDNGKGIYELLDIARKRVNDASNNPLVTAGCLIIFSILVKKGEGIQEAIEAAKQGVNDPDSDVRTAAIELLEILVEKGIPEAIEAAKEIRK
jgi:HEAT repeat protein